jgi:tetratricopeptide repeat protein
MDEVLDGCYGCGIVNDEYVIEIVGAPSRRPHAFVYQITSAGKVIFCDVCLEEGNFRDLTPEDRDLISWSFASTLAEHEPERAITLLEPLVEKWDRTAEVLSPLGRAYIALGRRNEGRSLLEEALRSWPNHPNAEHDKSLWPLSNSR